MSQFTPICPPCNQGRSCPKQDGNLSAIDWGRRVAELIETTEEMKLYPEQEEQAK